jgi:RimJ/RimL family protein N-acetyltransferase
VKQVNAYGQPIGPALPGWTERPWPPRTAMEGRYVRLEPLAPAHAADLHTANMEAPDGRNWTYLGVGPFERLEDYAAWVASASQMQDPLFHAIIDKATGKPVGVASYLRIDPKSGVIEVGHINYAPPLQRTPGATEAMFLMMRRAFNDLGYRRYEWKCDSLNAPSRRAADRLGFTYEGLFRQALVYKGRSRDTTWFAIVDSEWPALERAYVAWLDPSNFAADGTQKRSLADLIRESRAG